MEPARPTDGDPVRVVVVDDEPDVRFFVRHLLSRRRGFDVVGEGANGDEAVEVAARLQPDVLLLDLMMPTPGRHALPHILSVSPTTMVVVFSGADPTEADRRRLLDLGAFNLYEKGCADQLPELLESDVTRFRRALTGREVVVTWMTDWGGPVAPPAQELPRSL